MIMLPVVSRSARIALVVATVACISTVLGWKYVHRADDSTSQTVCGDGLKAAGEQCDDRNVQDGDGCSTACTVGGGYFCYGRPSGCVRVSESGIPGTVDAYVISLTDTNRDGSVSDEEALAVMLRATAALDAPYASVTHFDLDSDGDTDPMDAAVIGEAINRLTF